MRAVCFCLEGSESVGLHLRKWWSTRQQIQQNQSFSQKGEDRIIFELLGYPSRGFYVDVGAYHPMTFSNTYYFYLRGWRGINIEPMPHHYKLFVQDRMRDINLNCGVGRVSDNLTFYQLDPETLSTFSQAEAERVAQLPDHRLVQKYPVEVRSLRDIFEEQQPPIIDFLSIDVEGGEMDVLEGNDWSRWCPRVIVLETLKYSPTPGNFEERGMLSVFQPYLAEKGYRLAHDTQLNSIFIRQ
jgi:FkbM family methyltransferase